MFSKLFGTRDGNVAMIFALCLVPLLVFMGGAIDLSRQRGGEVGAQNALDAALLAVAHEALGKPEADLTRDGLKWFEAHLQNSNMEITSFSITKGDDTLSAEVKGKVGTTFLALMGLSDLKVVRRATVRIGLQKVEVALVLDTTGSMAAIANDTQSCAKKGCTGGTSKLAILRKSATNMMNVLEKASAGSDKIQVALVPFATYVNVGSDNANESWIDKGGNSPIHGDNLVDGLNRFDLYKHLGYSWKGCVEARPHPHDVRDTRPQVSKPETLFVPVFHPDEPDPANPWMSNSYPNNYVVDAKSLGNGLLDVSNPVKYGVPESILVYLLNETLTVTKSLLNTPFLNGSNDADMTDDCELLFDMNAGYGNSKECNVNPFNPANWEKVTINKNYTYFSDMTTTIGPEFGCEMRPIVPLTKDFEKLRTEISKLEAAGSTNLSEGVAWGWRVLSPGQPFNEAEKYSDAVNKILVFLSDGNNMLKERDGKVGGSDYSAYGYLENQRLDGTNASSDQDDILDAMDALTLEACSNIKKSGVRIITIRLDLTDSRSEKILSQCASSDDDFIDVQNVSELDEAFAKVTENITRLYLSK